VLLCNNEHFAAVDFYLLVCWNKSTKCH